MTKFDFYLETIRGESIMPKLDFYLKTIYDIDNLDIKSLLTVATANPGVPQHIAQPDQIQPLPFTITPPTHVVLTPTVTPPTHVVLTTTVVTDHITLDQFIQNLNDPMHDLHSLLAHGHF